MLISNLIKLKALKQEGLEEGMFEKNSKGVDEKKEDELQPKTSKVSLAISKCFFLPAYFC